VYFIFCKEITFNNVSMSNNEISNKFYRKLAGYSVNRLSN